jgi:hypothetical protein
LTTLMTGLTTSTGVTQPSLHSTSVPEPPLFRLPPACLAVAPVSPLLLLLFFCAPSCPLPPLPSLLPRTWRSPCLSHVHASLCTASLSFLFALPPPAWPCCLLGFGLPLPALPAPPPRPRRPRAVPRPSLRSAALVGPGGCVGSAPASPLFGRFLHSPP